MGDYKQTYVDMLGRIDQFLLDNEKDIIKDICDLVQIKSVCENETQGKPFGEGCYNALSHALNRCNQLGLDTYNNDNYYGVSYLGEGEKDLLVMAHLDVVPEGDLDKWTYGAYTPTVLGRYIIGRGSSDNKGSAVAGMYILKCLKELDVKLNHKVKVMFGCNEETGMKDAKYYVQKEKAPSFAITPDGGPSVCYGEKGSVGYDYVSPKLSGNILSLVGGVAANVVPEHASMVISTKAQIPQNIPNTITIETVDQGLKITAKGKPRHAAAPEGSVNAIYELCKFVTEEKLLTGEDFNAISFIKDVISDYNGASIGVSYEDEISGKLTHVGGLVNLVDGIIRLNIDIRYPVTLESSKVIDALEEFVKDKDYVIDILRSREPTYIPKDNPVVLKLAEIYNCIGEIEVEPFVMGGGTYASCFKNAAAYGPGFPEIKSPFENGRGGAHDFDEYVSIDGILKTIKIYIIALLELDKLL